MSFIDRIFRRSAPPAPETRDDAFYALSQSLGDRYVDGDGMHSVSSTRAESVSTVSACINLITSAISALPASIMADGAPVPATSPAARLLLRPSPTQSWPAFISWFTRQLLIHGNALARIATDGRGAVVALTPIRWDRVMPLILGPNDQTPRLGFDIANRSSEERLLGIPARLFAEDLLHCRMLSDDGILGRPILSRSASAVREGIEIARLAESNWRNALRASGIVSMEGTLKPEGVDRVRERIKAFKAEDKMGVLILDQSAKFQAMSMTSTDAQFIETRGLNSEQICNLFGVPVALVHTGQRAVQDLQPFVTTFYQQTIVPIVSLIEAEFANAILGPGMELAIDVDGAMRGSFASTVAALAALKQSGVVTANDCRAELDWPPIEGGDVLGTGPAPTWPADGPGSTHLGPSPGPTGDAPANVDTNQNKGSSS